MIKMNSRGFAHHVAIMGLVVVGIIGGIGSYIYLNSSSASTVKSVTIWSKDWPDRRYGATIVKDEGESVIKLARPGSLVTTRPPTTHEEESSPLLKLQNFLLTNAGKKFELCIKAKGPKGATVWYWLNYANSFPNGPGGNITLQHDNVYRKYCHTYRLPSAEKFAKWAQDEDNQVNHSALATRLEHSTKPVYIKRVNLSVVK